VLDALFASVFGDDAEEQAVRETYLALDDLKRIVEAGVELGVHTRNHRVLPRLPFAAQREEIEAGAAFLREVTGQKRFAVAYPYGFHDESTHRAMAELGMTAGLSMERRVITADDLRGRWNIPRYDVNDCFDRSSNEIVDEVFSQLPGAD
jgi:peptidoglycan/xylan/chitin deacetylase (PgdA/CDA1 family)